MRGNNFDFLRLALAALVVRCHSSIVGLYIPWTEDEYFLGGRSCVECFFVISGYLIFKSWDSTPSLSKYMEKRARRILPAYIFVVLLCALSLCTLSSLPLSEYFSNLDVYKYIGAHVLFLGFLQNTLPGVFEKNLQQYVNGPLWTIKIEVMFYVCVPLVAMLATRVRRAPLFATIYIGAIAWFIGFRYAALVANDHLFDGLARQLPSQMAFFIAGGAVHYFNTTFLRYKHLLFALSVALLTAHFTNGMMITYPAALAVAVVYIATCAPYFGNFARFGDLSYGLYIYHFPILQVLAAIHLPIESPLLTFAIGVVLAVVASFLSWHFIERRWLLKSSHYVQASDDKNAPDAVGILAMHGSGELSIRSSDGAGAARTGVDGDRFVGR